MSQELKLEPNQRLLKGTDGLERIFTFNVLTKREAMRANWLVGGVASAMSGGVASAMSGDDMPRMTDHDYIETVEPCARLILKGCVIQEVVSGDIFEIENFDESDFFVGRIQDMIQAILAAADVMGFIKPATVKDSVAGKTGETISKVSSIK